MSEKSSRGNLKLYAPESYWVATPDERELIVNGCGTSGWKGKLVPESLYGLSVSESCNIHDWMYHHGKDINDKNTADRVFLNNMIRTIEHKGGFCLLRKLRLRRARLYYRAVENFGGPAFWANKNKPEQFRPARYAHMSSVWTSKLEQT